MNKDWKRAYKAKPIQSKDEFRGLLKHFVDVVWLWDERYFIYDHFTKNKYIFSDADYPLGDDTLYKTRSTLQEICEAEGLEYGRSKVDNSYITNYFPYFVNYLNEKELR